MKSNYLILNVLAVLALAGSVPAGTALAGDDKVSPEGAAPASEVQSRPQAGAVLDVNRAELEAAEREGLAEGVGLAGLPSAPERPENPMMVEIRAVLDRAGEQSTQLQQRFQAATNEVEALGIQRELETLMQDSEIEILQIQARHARVRGDDATADSIEASIARILEPEIAVARKDRPRPNASN